MGYAEVNKLMFQILVVVVNDGNANLKLIQSKFCREVFL